MHAKSLLSCPTLCDPVDCSPSGSSVHGILQARVLEWVAMPSSRGSSQARGWTHNYYVSCIGRWVLYHSCHLESPKKIHRTPSNSEGTWHSTAAPTVHARPYSFLGSRTAHVCLEHHGTRKTKTASWLEFPVPCWPLRHFLAILSASVALLSRRLSGTRCKSSVTLSSTNNASKLVLTSLKLLRPWW